MMDYIRKKFQEWREGVLIKSLAGSNVTHLGHFFNRHPEKINQPLLNGETPLVTACRHGKIFAVEFLIEKGADVNLAGPDGTLPLNAAFENGHFSTFRFLLDHGGNPLLLDRKNLSAIDLAALAGNEDLTLRCLEVQKGRSAALHMAAFSGHARLVEKLLEAGADATAEDEGGKTVLQRALFPRPGKTVQARRDILAALLKAGASASAGEPPPFYLEAQGGGDPGILKALLEAGARANIRDASGKTAVHAAAVNANIAALELLIRLSPIDVNFQDAEGNTPLHLAAAHFLGDRRPSAILLAAGADPRLRNAKGESPLDMLRRDPKNASLIILLEKNATPPKDEEWKEAPGGVIWSRTNKEKSYTIAEQFNFASGLRTSIFRDLTVKASQADGFNNVIDKDSIEKAREMHDRIKRRKSSGF